MIFSEIITQQFLNFYDYYVQVCKDNADKDGTPMIVCKRKASDYSTIFCLN